MDMETFKKTKLLKIRLRVVNILKMWIKKDLPSIEQEPGTLQKLKDFLTFKMSPVMPKPASEILNLINNPTSEAPPTSINGPDAENSTFISKPPMPHIPGNLKGKLTFNDMHPEEIARQITLIEHQLYKAIQPTECLGLKWTKPNKNELAPNICKMINRFNQVSVWVATEILEVEDLKLRAVTLNRFIFVAQKCRELNNYNGVMEILSALQGSSIHRLKQTWDVSCCRFCFFFFLCCFVVRFFKTHFTFLILEIVNSASNLGSLRRASPFDGHRGQLQELQRRNENSCASRRSLPR
jgi:hypothetical protein